jgi:hypothetical protein
MNNREIELLEKIERLKERKKELKSYNVRYGEESLYFEKKLEKKKEKYRDRCDLYQTLLTESDPNWKKYLLESDKALLKIKE